MAEPDVTSVLTNATHSLTNAIAGLTNTSASLQAASSALTNATSSLTNSLSSLIDQGFLAGSRPIYHGLSLADIVLLGSLLATFIASVIAEEQNQRLKNGTFGAIAGTTVGGLASLITQEKSLIFMGFFGSAAGALLGWMVACGFSIWAAKSQFGRTVLNYLIGGWKGVVEKIELERVESLIESMQHWERSFVHRRQKEKEALLALQKNQTTNDSIRMAVEGCLLATVDVFGLLLHVAKKPEYRSRITIIIFGKSLPAPPPGTPDNNAVVGRHWISYSGTLPSHKRTQEFDVNSVGFQVLTEKLASPNFTPGDDAKSKGQDRGQQKYRPFLTFRLSESAVLALDWPEDLTESDLFVGEARSFFQNEICPLIQAFLSHWDGDVQKEVGLRPR